MAQDKGEGLPREEIGGSLLIRHRNYGWMVGRWSVGDNCYAAACVREISPGRLTPQVVLYREEQAEFAVEWALLPELAKNDPLLFSELTPFTGPDGEVYYAQAGF